MLNFFAIVVIIFIGTLLLILKKISIKKLINKDNKCSNKFKKNNKFSSNKNSFLYNHQEKSTHYFIKILK